MANSDTEKSGGYTVDGGIVVPNFEQELGWNSCEPEQFEINLNLMFSMVDDDFETPLRVAANFAREAVSVAGVGSGGDVFRQTLASDHRFFLSMVMLRDSVIIPFVTYLRRSRDFVSKKFSPEFYAMLMTSLTELCDILKRCTPDNILEFARIFFVKSRAVKLKALELIKIQKYEQIMFDRKTSIRDKGEILLECFNGKSGEFVRSAIVSGAVDSVRAAVHNFQDSFNDYERIDRKKFDLMRKIQELIFRIQRSVWSRYDEAEDLSIEDKNVLALLSGYDASLPNFAKAERTEASAILKECVEFFNECDKNIEDVCERIGDGDFAILNSFDAEKLRSVLYVIRQKLYTMGQTVDVQRHFESNMLKALRDAYLRLEHTFKDVHESRVDASVLKTRMQEFHRRIVDFGMAYSASVQDGYLPEV